MVWLMCLRQQNRILSQTNNNRLPQLCVLNVSAYCRFGTLQLVGVCYGTLVYSSACAFIAKVKIDNYIVVRTCIKSTTAYILFI